MLQSRRKLKSMKTSIIGYLAILSISSFRKRSRKYQFYYVHVTTLFGMATIPRCVNHQALLLPTLPYSCPMLANGALHNTISTCPQESQDIVFVCLWKWAVCVVLLCHYIAATDWPPFTSIKCAKSKEAVLPGWYSWPRTLRLFRRHVPNTSPEAWWMSKDRHNQLSSLRLSSYFIYGTNFSELIILIFVTKEKSHSFTPATSTPSSLP